MRVKLVAFILRSPNSPWFKEYKWIFKIWERFSDFSLGKPHQKILKLLFKVLQIEAGRIKVLITYFGIATAVALIRTILQAWVFVRHPVIFDKPYPEWVERLFFFLI